MGETIEFGFAWAFLLLGLFAFCSWRCPMRLRTLYFAHLERFGAFGHTAWSTWLKWTAIIMLVIALAAPYSARHIDITPKEGFDIALLLDASLSMREQGFERANMALSRFDVVKTIVADFVKKRDNDNLGLVVFGEFAFIASPLTYDKKILSDIVNRLQIGMAGKATAIYDALGQGVKLLKNSQAKTKIAILLTDGQNTAFNVGLDDVLKMAKKYDIRIYTVGIGYEGEFNQVLLNNIASQTGGRMYKAHSGEELSSVYTHIDTLEKSQIKSQSFEKRTYYYHLPLTLAIASLLGFLWVRFYRSGV